MRLKATVVYEVPDLVTMGELQNFQDEVYALTEKHGFTALSVTTVKGK